MTENVTKRTAAIAGGGLAGLTVAAVLAKRGWEVEVFERAPDLREIGAGLYLRENSLRVLDYLGVSDYVAQDGVRLMAQCVYSGEKTLVERDISHLRKFCVERTHIQRWLYEAAVEAGATIHYGETVIGAEPEGRLLLAGGERVRADLVLGADGFRSSVRDSLGLARRVHEQRDGCTRVLIRRGDEPPMTVERWSGKLRTGGSPCSSEHTYIYLCSPEDDEVAKRVPVEAEYWARRFPAQEVLLQRLTRPVAVTRHPLPYARCRSWVAGRVAIIGDAAHAQPPNLGQGAGLAIGNALHLADAIDRAGEVESGLRAWDARARPLGEAVQRWSCAYGRLAGSPTARVLKLAALRWTLEHVAPVGRRWEYVSSGGSEQERPQVRSVTDSSTGIHA